MRRGLKVGDHAIYDPKGMKLPCRIVQGLHYDSNHNSWTYRVKFKDPNRCPNKMTVPSYKVGLDEDESLYQQFENMLIDLDALDMAVNQDALGFEENNYDPEFECPKCGKIWNETLFGMKKWYDCIKCNIKREDVWKG